MKKQIGILTVLTVGAVLQIAVAGEIVGTVTLKGNPPAEKDFDKTDPNCGQPAKGSTHHYVVGSKGELANVVVSIEGAPAKSTGPSAEPVVLDQKNCEYVPGIFAVQTGQKITIKNSDPTMHNVHTEPAGGSENKVFNEAQMASAPDKTYVPTKPETFLKVKCDVHPWMFAWFSVFDNPYFAVSGKDGTFKIANIPAGKYKLKAAHRKAGETVQEIEVKEGAPAKVTFTLDVK